MVVAFVRKGSQRQNRGQQTPTQPRSGDGARQRLQFRGRQPLPEDDQGDRNHQKTVGIVGIDQPDRGSRSKSLARKPSREPEPWPQGPRVVSARVVDPGRCAVRWNPPLSSIDLHRLPLRSRSSLKAHSVRGSHGSLIDGRIVEWQTTRPFDTKPGLPGSPSQQSLSRLDRRADSVPMGCKSIPDKRKNRATVRSGVVPG